MAKKSSFGTLALTIGAILIGLSLLAYMFIENGFISEVQSEVFGVGAALLVFGLIFVLFKVKVG